MEEKNPELTNGEIKEESIEPAEGMPIISIPSKGLSIEREIEQVEKNIELFNRIKTVSLKLTKINDWIDQGGNPYLMDRGAENIAIAWGVDISEVKLRQEWAEDEKGRYYTYVTSGKAYAKKLGRYVEDIGVCSQRDRFFGMIKGELKPIEDVDMANIRRKAVTNLYTRLIKRVIGLMNVTFDDLKLAGLDISKIVKIEYKDRSQKSVVDFSPKGKEVKKKLSDMLMMMANDDKKVAVALLEKFSSWTDRDGREHKASSINSLSEKWMNLIYGRVKAEYEKTSGGPEEREPGQEG